MAAAGTANAGIIAKAEIRPGDTFDNVEELREFFDNDALREAIASIGPVDERRRLGIVREVDRPDGLRFPDDTFAVVHIFGPQREQALLLVTDMRAPVEIPDGFRIGRASFVGTRRPVPEPASSAVFVIGTGIAAGAIWRKRKTTS